LACCPTLSFGRVASTNVEGENNVLKKARANGPLEFLREFHAAVVRRAGKKLTMWRALVRGGGRAAGPRTVSLIATQFAMAKHQLLERTHDEARTGKVVGFRSDDGHMPFLWRKARSVASAATRRSLACRAVTK